MPVKLKSLLASGLVAFALLILPFWVLDKNGTIRETGFLFLGVFLPLLVESFIEYYGHIMTLIRSFYIRRIRISFAYLIRVQINDDFLLVKSKRFDLFQPPGGVFEYYRDDIIDDFSLVGDEALNNVSKKDLRKTVTNPRKLIKIVTWFSSRKDREVSPHREFIEELLDGQILDPAKFKWLDFKFIKVVNPGITYSEHFKLDELKIFEVFEFVPSDEQKIELLKLAQVTSDKYKIVSREIINRNGFCKSTNQTVNLGTQTKHLF